MSVLIIAGTILTGCSSGYDPNQPLTMGWDSGTITYKGKPTGLTEYKGSTAMVTGGNGGIDYSFSIDPGCATVTNITANNQGIEEANMSTYKGKYYYLEYLSTKMTMAKKVFDQTYMVCQLYTNGLNEQLLAQYCSEYMDSFQLCTGGYYVDFGDFIFGTGYDIINMTNAYVSVTGTVKISLDSKGCSEPYTFTNQDGKKSVEMYRTVGDKYTYYEYNGYLIQIANGIDPNMYITIK